VCVNTGSTTATPAERRPDPVNVRGQRTSALCRRSRSSSAPGGLAASSASNSIPHRAKIRLGTWRPRRAAVPKHWAALVLGLVVAVVRITESNGPASKYGYAVSMDGCRAPPSRLAIGPGQPAIGPGQPVGSDRGALPGLLLVGFPGPPAAPGLRLPPHRALHVSCPLGLAGCRDRLGCSRGRYAAAAVAVAGDRHD
jgi:hypothetical protein